MTGVRHIGGEGPTHSPACGPRILGSCSLQPDDCPPKWMLELSESVLNRVLYPLTQQMFTEPWHVPGVVLCPGQGGVKETDKNARLLKLPFLTILSRSCPLWCLMTTEGKPETSNQTWVLTSSSCAR